MSIAQLVPEDETCAVVAYVILSHREPEQVQRLVMRLLEGSPSSHVYIHHDPAGPTLMPETFGPRVHPVLPARSVAWGDMSLVQANMDAFRLVQRHSDPDWVVLLSGQDYPLRPVVQIERDLMRSPYVALLDIWSFDDPPWQRGEESSRYLYRYSRWFERHGLAAPISQVLSRLYRDGEGRRVDADDPWRASQRFVARAVAGHLLVGWRPWRAQFSHTQPCYVGAQWLSLSRAALAAVVEDGSQARRRHRHFTRTIIPDESYFHTILGCAFPAERLGSSRRYASWRVGAHPEILTVADLPELLTSTDHFGRKFDVKVDAAVLDELDKRL